MELLPGLSEQVPSGEGPAGQKHQRGGESGMQQQAEATVEAKAGGQRSRQELRPRPCRPGRAGP